MKTDYRPESFGCPGPILPKIFPIVFSVWLFSKNRFQDLRLKSHFNSENLERRRRISSVVLMHALHGLHGVCFLSRKLCMFFLRENFACSDVSWVFRVFFSKWSFFRNALARHSWCMRNQFSIVTGLLTSLFNFSKIQLIDTKNIDTNGRTTAGISFSTIFKRRQYV